MAITGLKLHSPMVVNETENFTATAILTQGEMFKLEDTVMIAVSAAAIGDSIGVLTKAPSITFPCEAAGSGDYAQGAKVYFDAAT